MEDNLCGDKHCSRNADALLQWCAFITWCCGILASNSVFSHWDVHFTKSYCKVFTQVDAVAKLKLPLLPCLLGCSLWFHWRGGTVTSTLFTIHVKNIRTTSVASLKPIRSCLSDFLVVVITGLYDFNLMEILELFVAKKSIQSNTSLLKNHEYCTCMSKHQRVTNLWCMLSSRYQRMDAHLVISCHYCIMTMEYDHINLFYTFPWLYMIH